MKIHKGRHLPEGYHYFGNSHLSQSSAAQTAMKLRSIKGTRARVIKTNKYCWSVIYKDTK